MKLNGKYVLREVAGQTIVLPADAVNLDAMITLNETGAFLWKLLEEQTDVDALVQAMTEEFEVDETTARAHIEAFVKKMKELDLLV